MRDPIARLNIDHAVRLGWSRFQSSREAAFCMMLSSAGMDPTDVDLQAKVEGYRTDFSRPGKRAVVEVDGPHHERPRVAAADKARDRAMALAGWWVRRVDAYDEVAMAAAAVELATAPGYWGPDRSAPWVTLWRYDEGPLRPWWVARCPYCRRVVEGGTGFVAEVLVADYCRMLDLPHGGHNIDAAWWQIERRRGPRNRPT